LHVKLGVIKISVKAKYKEIEGFTYFKAKISHSKWGQDERIFITQLFEDQAFIPELNSAEQWAWKAFKNVCRNFIGNEKTETVKLCGC